MLSVVALVALVRFDMIVSVDYVRANARYVVHKPGYDWNHRIAVVTVDDGDRVLQTSDVLIDLHPGQPACVRRARLLARQWTRYSLALDPFCGAPVAASLAAEAQGA
ncbi:hypothetical protein [Actibacterium ureilyticum]|uniref:hypothetical protein n=1 Tax=Actibacterium ureilyticum TaxID=1590614 RepID=UPI001140F6C5|nr:hypothetical protein [Actibacterium ureilyticum]